MATKSFNNSADTAVLEPEENTSLVSHSDPAPAFSSSDIQIPRLSVVQKMSELDIDAPVGSFVLAKETVLYRAGIKVPSVILSARKYWKEKISFDSDEIPQFAATQEAADELAANSQYDIINVADIAVLIQKTSDAEAGSDEVFCFEFDGHQYAMGKMTVQNKAYDCTLKSLASFAVFNPKIDPASIFWNLSSFSVSKSKYTWNVPNLSPTKELVGPEAAEFAARLKG